MSEAELKEPPSDEAVADDVMLRPPSALEPAEEKQRWCALKVERVLAEAPNADLPPEGARSSYRWEVEFWSCVLDPEQYERDVEYERGRD